MIKILLISHPAEQKVKPDYPAPGISYLAAVAKRDGYDVKLIDGALRATDYILKSVVSYAPDLIGISCWTINRGAVWRLAKRLKDICPNVPLIIGGQHPTYYPAHVFAKTHATAVVLGEGEETFSELLHALKHGDNLENVPGLALRGANNEVIMTPPRPIIADLDAIPFPDYEAYDEFDFADYAGSPLLRGPVAAVISSRGCIYNCSYCSSVRFWGSKWRFRSAENVLGELKQLVEIHKVKSIFFFDDNFMVRSSRVEAICHGIINLGLNIQWACASHVKMVKNVDLLLLMKKSGCVSIDFGVESGSAKILENINKNQTPEDIARAFELVRKAGIIGRAYLMIGNQGEDETTVDETISMISKIGEYKTYIGAAILMLLPGTDVYNNALRSGHIRDDYWLEEDGVPYNLQEHTYQELDQLRNRLMYGIAKSSGNFIPLLSYYLKILYYKYPFLTRFRQYIPRYFR